MRLRYQASCLIIDYNEKPLCTFSVDEVKILLEKQKQACANEFIHAEMTMEQAKRRVLNTPTVSF